MASRKPLGDMRSLRGSDWTSLPSKPEVRRPRWPGPAPPRRSVARVVPCLKAANRHRYNVDGDNGLQVEGFQQGDPVKALAGADY